jgi:hypothetical protein
MPKPNFPPTRRFGESLAFDVPHQTADAAEDSQFITDVAEGLQAQDTDEPEPESREELKKKIQAEVLRELHQRLVVKPAPPEPPPRAGFVRDPSVDNFFELAAEEKAARRRRGH